MLFCLNADYTAQALNAMRENASTNRAGAVEKLVEAAGGMPTEIDAAQKPQRGHNLFEPPPFRPSPTITRQAVRR